MHRVYALICLLLISVASFAQEDRATLTGSATDSAGRLVDNATISVTDVATGIVRTAQTNESGRYVLTGLIVGNYRAECSAASFETIAVQEFKLAVGQETVINFKLMPPSVNTKIEV